MGKYLVPVVVAALLLSSCGPVGTPIPQKTGTPGSATPTPRTSVFDNLQLGYRFDLQYTWPSSQKQEVLTVDNSNPWQVKTTSATYPEVTLWIWTTDRLGLLYTAEQLASYWPYPDTAQKSSSMIGGGSAFAVPAYVVLLEYNGLYKEYWVATQDFSYLLTLHVEGITLADLQTTTDQLTQTNADLIDCLSQMAQHFTLCQKAEYAK